MLNDHRAQLRLLSQRERQLTSENRFTDFGIKLYVVEQDPNGTEVYANRPPVSTVSVHNYGGVWDNRANCWHSESPDPIVLFCSREQFPLIIHGDDLPPRVLLYGAMGAGKTRGVLAPWFLMRIIEFAGQHVEIGGTAPTSGRLDRLREAIAEVCDPSWYSYSVRHSLFRFHLGVSVRLVSTHQRSADAGSPVQGFDWAAHGGDELQDQLAANSDIEARGRRAPFGVYKRMNTATAKDSPKWRDFRDSLDVSLWGVRRLEGTTNVFVWPRYWQDLKKTMSERDYQRKVLALDVGPESMLYHTWRRDRNLIPVPTIGAKDVTAKVLASYGQNLQALLGHDPGQIQDYTCVLKAFQFKGERRHRWIVVGEFRTKQTTSEQHATQLMTYLQDVHGLMYKGADEPKVLLQMDPYGTNDQKTDRSVYLTFRKAGFDPRSAAFKNGKGNGRIPKEPRIEMVCTLVRNANGESWLYVGQDETGKPLAPLMVESLELSERDAAGQAETIKKRIKGAGGDLSDPTAALGYALWRQERIRAKQGSEAVVVY